MKPYSLGEDLAHPAAIGADEIFLIAGPCVIETEEHALELGGRIAEIARAAGMPYVFKASFDKANRTSIDSYRGPGIDKGLEILARARGELGVPVLTDLHEPGQAGPVGAVVDVIQVPAFLSRQTDLLIACAQTGKCVNVKKAQFMAPEDMTHVVGKLRQAGAKQIMATERGASFGYHNLVTDLRSLVEMAKLDCPIVFDATHSVQTPSGAGSASGGRREYIEPLVRGAVAVGVQGVFLEVHEAPDHALCDGPNALHLDRLPAVLDMIQRIDRARRECE